MQRPAAAVLAAGPAACVTKNSGSKLPHSTVRYAPSRGIAGLIAMVPEAVAESALERPDRSGVGGTTGENQYYAYDLKQKG